MDQLGVDNVVVIPPHMDDAVFSISGLIYAVRDRCEVITLFTEPLPGETSDWARLTGFTDNEAEFRARRQEDLAAMKRIGYQFQHLGLIAGNTAATSISQIVKVIEQARPGRMTQTLVLLPAGAGGLPPASRLWRFVMRCLRRPSGAMPHGDHVMARDLFWETCRKPHPRRVLRRIALRLVAQRAAVAATFAHDPTLLHRACALLTQR